MKTEALIEALCAAHIDPAVALRLFALWLDSTAEEMELQLLDSAANTLRDLSAHLHANAKHIEGEADNAAYWIEQQNEDRRGWLKMTDGEEHP